VGERDDELALLDLRHLAMAATFSPGSMPTKLTIARPLLVRGASGIS
jgi:hypothetical protein